MSGSKNDDRVFDFLELWCVNDAALCYEHKQIDAHRPA